MESKEIAGCGMSSKKVKSMLKNKPEYSNEGLDFDNAPAKLHVADRYVKKVWNPARDKFKYIYPKDIEKEGRKIAKESITASKKKDLPRKMKLSNPIESNFSTKDKDVMKGGIADKVSDDKFSKKSLKQGKKIEKEHTKSPQLAKEIAKDHLTEHPNYYKELQKMEKKLETQDLYSAAAINGNKININNNTVAAAKAEFADGKVGRSWKWKDHDYSSRTGPKGEYKYEYKGEVSPQEEAARRQVRERNEKIENQKATGTQKGMNNSETTKQIRPTESSNPQSTDQYLSGSPRPGGNMADQAKQSGNVFGQTPNANKQAPPVRNSFMSALNMPQQQNIIGNPDSEQTYARQEDPAQNPLHADRLTPEQAQRYGDCHKMAAARAAQTGGVKYTTTGRAGNFHSITRDPDGTIYDYVLGIQGMPADKYFSEVPYSFAPNPNV